MSDDKRKRQLFAEAYGMGDVKVGTTITGEYPNAPALDDTTATAYAYLRGEQIPKSEFWRWCFAAAYRDGGLDLLKTAIVAREVQVNRGPSVHREEDWRKYWQE